MKLTLKVLTLIELTLMKWISDWIIQTDFLALTLPDSPAVFTNLSASNSAHFLISSDICKMKETRVKLVHPKQRLWNITRLILPVVKVGLTAERTSFHSSSRIKLIILRKYLLLTSKDLKKFIKVHQLNLIISKFIQSPYTTVDEVVEIFDQNRADEVGISH